MKMLDSNFSDFIEVRSIQNDYELEQAAICVCQNQVQDECVAQSLNLSFNDIYNGFILPCFPRLKKFLELQIVSVSNGKIVGALFSQDLFDPFKPQFTEQNLALDEICEQFKDKLLSEKIIQPVAGYYLHIFFLGIDPSYRSKDLARRMVEMAIEKAPLRGFKEVFAECTSPTSTYLAKKIGFQEIGKQIYKNFRSKNGQNPYAQTEELYGSDADTFLLLKMQEKKEKAEVYLYAKIQSQINNQNSINNQLSNKHIQLTK